MPCASTKAPLRAVRTGRFLLRSHCQWFQTPASESNIQPTPACRTPFCNPPALQFACLLQSPSDAVPRKKIMKKIRSWRSSGERSGGGLDENGLARGRLRRRRSAYFWTRSSCSLSQALVVLSVLATHTAPATRRPGRGEEARRCSRSRESCISGRTLSTAQS
jgi:hypothetical protein